MQAADKSAPLAETPGPMIATVAAAAAAEQTSALGMVPRLYISNLDNGTAEVP